MRQRPDGERKATIPIAGQEVKNMVISGELTESDEYLSESVHLSVKGKEEPLIKETNDRLTKSGL